MRPKVIKGILYIPAPEIDKERGIYADGMIQINKTHPDYDYWYNLLPHKKKKSLSNIPTGVTGEALKVKGKIEKYIFEEGEKVYVLDDSWIHKNPFKDPPKGSKKIGK